MTISVIVATYNRAALLADCLGHMAQLRFEPGDQVVVVDNKSTDGTRQVIIEARSRFPVPLIHLEESTPGKSRALARALDIATGDIFAFTDDDVEVDHSWLEAIRDAMADPTTAMAGGPVMPRWECEAPRWLRLSAENYGRLAAPLALLKYDPGLTELGPRTLLGANLSVRKDVFSHVGGFAPHLGKLRGTLLSGEDHDLCRRVQAAGFRAVYCPNACVWHHVPAERMRVSYYLSWFFWSGITNAILDADASHVGRSLFGVPRYLLRRIATAGFGAVGAAVVGNQTDAIDHAIDVAFAAGYAAHRWGLIRRD
jgi:GT2 family glycosyltransferase